MISKEKALDKFGKVLVEKVRDEAIDVMCLVLRGQMNSQESKELYAEARFLSPEQINLVERFIRHTVDNTLHHFLWMIEQEDDVDLVVYETDDKKPISLKEISDGLCGEPYTEDGWIERFSQFPPSIK